MKIYQFKMLVTLLLMASGDIFGSPPASTTQNWMLQLQKVYVAEKDFINNVFANEDCWYVKYQMSSVIWNAYENKYQTVSSEGELSATVDSRTIKSAQMEVYMDKNDVFTIHKPAKLVMRTQSVKMDLIRSNAYFDLLNDSIMDNYRLIACEQVNEAEGKLTRYDILSATKKTPFLRMSLYVDDAKSTFRKIRVEMNPAYSHEIKEYTIVIKERSRRTPEKSLLPVKDRILAANGKLKPAYGQYKYRDLKKPVQ